MPTKSSVHRFQFLGVILFLLGALQYLEILIR